MLRLALMLVAVVAAKASASADSYYEGRSRHAHDGVARQRADDAARVADRYAGDADREKNKFDQNWRGFPFDDDDDDDDDWDKGGWHSGGKKNKKKHDHGGYDDDDGYDSGKGYGGYGGGGGDGQGYGDGRGDDQGYGGNGGDDPSHVARPTDVPGPQDPLKQVRSAQQIRENTEGFVSAVLAWVNELVTADAASTLIVDTTFSLTKSEGANIQLGSGTSRGLSQLFPVVDKFVSHPQDVDLLEEDVQALGWTASLESSGTPKDAELEGGIYAAFQITCGQLIVLNVSISSSGSTPTLQGEPVENSGLYVDVSILDGRIQATDGQGSVIGFLKRRHYPENAEEVLKNWTATVQGCATAKTLAISGAVGGGWTAYKPDDTTAGAYKQFTIGYTESFTFKFPEEDSNVSSSPPVDTVPPGTLRAFAENQLPRVTAPATDVASAIATAYVQTGTSCTQRPAPAHSLSCSGLAVMAQLQSFHHHVEAAARVTSAMQFQETSSQPPRASVYVGIAGVFALVVAFATLTQRRRNGYEEVHTQV